MLDLNQIDLGDLAEALDDRSFDHSWWFDPATGEVVLWREYLEEHGEQDPEARGLRPIEPVPSHESYADMADFVERVEDPKARDLFARAIAGRGAFRRFKDMLLDFPELSETWFRFRDPAPSGGQSSGSPTRVWSRTRPRGARSRNVRTPSCRRL